MIDADRLTTVVVRRQALDSAGQPDKAYDLVQAVVDYVNNIQREGVYHARELPAAAIQAYHADYYLAQVNNGGHSQFIGNAGINFPEMAADALLGLEAMGLLEHHRVLSEMIAWANGNPEEAAAQNGFSVRAELLEELDTRFYEAEKQTSMIERSAKWIANWPNLRAVEDDQYTAEIMQLAQMNPHLALRKIWQGRQSLRYQMTDQLQLTVAMACGAVIPNPEIKLVVRPGSYMQIEGENCMAFGVSTDSGTRLCVIEETGGRLYEFIVHKPVRGQPYKAATAGARLSAVTAETILNFREMTERTLACEAIDLLLRKVGLAPATAVTAWKLHENGATWIVVSGPSRLVATTSTDRATLTQRDDAPVAAVTRAEIEQHAADAERGGASMQQVV